MRLEETSILCRFDLELLGRKNILLYTALMVGVGAFFASGLRLLNVFVFNFLVVMTMSRFADTMFSRDGAEFLFVNMTATDITSYVVAKNVNMFILNIIFLFSSNMAFIAVMSWRSGGVGFEAHADLLLFYPYIVCVMLALENPVARRNLIAGRKVTPFFTALAVMIISGIAVGIYVLSLKFMGAMFILLILLPLSVLIFMLSIIRCRESLSRAISELFDI